METVSANAYTVNTSLCRDQHELRLARHEITELKADLTASKRVIAWEKANYRRMVKKRDGSQFKDLEYIEKLEKKLKVDWLKICLKCSAYPCDAIAKAITCRKKGTKPTTDLDTLTKEEYVDLMERLKKVDYTPTFKDTPEAVKVGKRILAKKRYINCPKCEGNGKLPIFRDGKFLKCDKCGGKGKVLATQVCKCCEGNGFIENCKKHEWEYKTASTLECAKCGATKNSPEANSER
jgi:RecJ-like exonuclease